MTLKKRPRLSPTQPFPRFKLTAAAAEFRTAYMLLPIPERRLVEHFLLSQAFLPGGTDAYRHTGQMFYESDTEGCVAKLARASLAISTAWFAWALEISNTRPSRIGCRECLFGLLSYLIHEETFETRPEWSAHTEGKTTY